MGRTSPDLSYPSPAAVCTQRAQRRPLILAGVFPIFVTVLLSATDGKPAAIDLFSGAGGLTLGLKQAGFDVIGAIEIDSLCAETYKLNHPGVAVWEKDIQTVPVSAVKRRLGLRVGELGLLAGCPPCQGFSSIRTLNGGRAVRDGSRNLVLEFVRFVEGLKPKAVMLENVPGLGGDRRMRKVLVRLSQLGYTCRWRVLNAADYAVPQRRKRLILLGSLAGAVPFARPAVTRRSVREVICGLPRPGTSGDELHDLPENRSQRVLRLIRRVQCDGGGRRALGLRYQLECHRTTNGFRDVYGRMAWDDVAPTITGGCINPSKGRFLHPSQNRAITLREAALLQTFPKSYFFSLERGKYAAAAMIGNALPPEFIRRHAKEVLRHLQQHTADD